LGVGDADLLALDGLCCLYRLVQERGLEVAAMSFQNSADQQFSASASTCWMPELIAEAAWWKYPAYRRTSVPAAGNLSRFRRR
jgi:hypothetical protein